jgi:hypothetical protein
MHYRYANIPNIKINIFLSNLDFLGPPLKKEEINENKDYKG